jgi:hypothetical protein
LIISLQNIVDTVLIDKVFFCCDGFIAELLIGMYPVSAVQRLSAVVAKNGGAMADQADLDIFIILK